MGKILVVENDVTWYDGFVNVIGALGEKREFQMVDFPRLINGYSQASAFDGIDFCFIDLELGPSSKPDLNDTLGLNEVLPRIKKIAPWLPCALLSRYISGESAVLGDVSVSDFDGIYPKDVIWYNGKTHPAFNSVKWKRILSQITTRRLSSLTAKPVSYLNKLLDNSDSVKIVKSKIDPIYKLPEEEDLRKVLSILDLGASSVSIEPILLGNSGISVVKVTVFGRDAERGEIRNSWLLKFGTSINKLVQECHAHDRVFRKGFHRTLMVPMLYSNVFVWNGVGYVIYSFEEGSITGLESVKNGEVNSLHLICDELFPQLYKPLHCHPYFALQTLSEWCSLNQEEIETFDFPGLNKTYQLTSTLIHGDLHLRNILVRNGRSLIIDFARSSVGPIAIDFAKLFLDTLVFCFPEEIDRISFSEAGILKSGKLNKIIEHSFVFFMEVDDKPFMSLALLCFAQKYITYPDVPSEVKLKLKQAIEKTIIEIRVINI